MKVIIVIKPDTSGWKEFEIGKEARKLADQFEEKFTGKELDLHIELAGEKK